MRSTGAAAFGARLLRRLLCGTLLGLGLAAGPAFAQTLKVGPDEDYKTIAAAARTARPGDTILIAAGTYNECAVWRSGHIAIVGAGSGATFIGRICGGKAIFVIEGSGVAIRNIRFANATADDGNGAGVRAEGVDLLIENCAFTNNQDGILTDNEPQSTLIVRNSTFDGNGTCIEKHGCAHAVYAGHIALLRVEGSHFTNTKSGHDVKSRALRTEIVASTIEDGAAGTSSYLVDIPNGGSLLLEGDTLEKGPESENPSAAVMIGEEGHLQPAGAIIVRQNTFTNDGAPTVFVRNRTMDPAMLAGNIIKGNPVSPLAGPGQIR